MLTRYISPKIVRYFNHIPFSYSFSTLSKVNFTEYTRVYRRPVTADEFEYIIEDEAKKVSFNMPEDATIGELETKLRELSPDVKSVQALSLDMAELANITKLRELSDETYYIVINNENLCKMMSLEKNEADVFERAYKKREEACQNAGLPFIEQQIILNYLKRVDVLNGEALGNKLFTDSNVYEGKVDKKLIIKNLLDGIIPDKNHSISSERGLIAELHQARARLNELQMQHEALTLKAHAATKRKMTLGLLLLLGQFSFVGVGTYVLLSWDLMEPMAYFLGLFGSITLSALYFSIYSDYSNFGFMKHLRQKELIKLYRKHGFPIDDMKHLEATVKILEKKIKSNILIDL